MTILFSNSRPKIPRSHIFGHKFRQNLQLNKFEGADFKYEFQPKIPAQKYPNKAILVPNLQIFILHQTLQSEKFEAFFVLNVSIFKFCMKLRISRLLIRKMEIVFFKFRPKVHKYKILFENSKCFFSLSKIFSELSFI